MRHPPSHQRHTSRRVGIIAAIATLIFVGGLMQAGVLKGMFRDELTLRVELPESGLAGLNEGASVEVLGTDAGRVTEIVLKPDAPFYAKVALDPDMKPFVRRDSTAVIRKQFGIAGRAYLAIERGTGPPLDWDFAVIASRSDPTLNESLTGMLDDARDRVFPVIDETRRAAASLAKLAEGLAEPDGEFRRTLTHLEDITGDVAAGRGSVGRLVSDDTAARGIERAVKTLNQDLDHLSRALKSAESGTADLAETAAALRDPETGLPSAVRRANRSLKILRQTLENVSKSAPAIRQTARNTADASQTLPSLLIRTEATLSELSGVLRQIRRSWLLGGGESGGPPERLSPVERPGQ